MNSTRKHILIISTALVFGQAAQAALYDRGGGLIYDDLLDVTWLQNITLAAGSGYDDDDPTDKLELIPGHNVYADGLLSYNSAQAWTDALEYYDPIRNVIWSDWRLPRALPVNGSNLVMRRMFDGSTDMGYNIVSPQHELSFMYYVNLHNIGQYDTMGQLQNGYGLLDNPADPNDESLFVNLITGKYWYSTVHPANDDNAMDFRMQYGNTTAADFDYVRYTWAVRDGDVAVPIPEAQTWAMLLAGIGVLVLITHRRLN